MGFLLYFLFSFAFYTKSSYDLTIALRNIYLPAVIGLTPTLHRSPPNIELPHNPSPIAIFVMLAPNGGKPCDGNRAPKMELYTTIHFRNVKQFGKVFVLIYKNHLGF